MLAIHPHAEVEQVLSKSRLREAILQSAGVILAESAVPLARAAGAHRSGRVLEDLRTGVIEVQQFGRWNVRDWVLVVDHSEGLQLVGGERRVFLISDSWLTEVIGRW